MTELSVIILCYRSEESIIEFARKTKTLLENITNSFEIVLVGNYFENSDDKTKKYIEILENEDKVFRGICKPKNGMMGWDMKEGLKIAKGNYLCVIDGDGQFPIDSISQCYSKIKEEKIGLVKTHRETRKDGLYRKTISAIYNSFFKTLFPQVNSNDVNSKPKIMTRDFYESIDLKSDDWFIDAEIMINVGKSNTPFYEIPVTFDKLDNRKSFVKPQAIIEFMINLVKYRLNY